MSCGPGSCRDGRCSCHWGFAGERCEHSTDAFAFLLYGDRIVNLVMARVLVRSLRVAGWAHDVLAIVPRASATPQAFLAILEADGVKVRFVDDIPLPASMEADPIIQSRWSGVMNKFSVWRLTEYSRVALLDVDIVFDVGSDSPMDIFEECNSPLCAARDGDPRFINAGVMVVTPSEQRLDHLLRALREERHHYDMPEQSFLTRYSEKKSNRLKLTELGGKWNSCAGGGMLFNLGWAASGYNVLHFCSWGLKPPNVRMCFKGECDQGEERHAVLVWQRHQASVDPCILSRREDSCQMQARCAWCGHYCSDERIPCSPDLFKGRLDQSDSEDDLELALKTCMARSQNESVTKGNWDDAPSGWWAWPRGGVYQVLLDRFASPSEKPCPDLASYCGGTLAAMRHKLGYLQKLGTDGIILSPVVDNMPGGYHGYWPRDLDTVSFRLGSRETLLSLISDSHRRGMRVFADVNLNHAGGPGLETDELIPKLKPFNKPEHFHVANCSLFSPEDFEQSQQLLERCKLFGLPDYNHENPEIWQGLMRWVRHHVDMYGFDGIRIDAAKHMPRAFLRHVPSKGSSIPAFHEVISDNMASIASYANNDYDALYNYPLYFALKGAFMPGPKRQPMTDILRTASQGEGHGRLTLNFLDNNDMPRFIRFVGGDGALFRNALLYVLGTEGVPVILYGSEQNVAGPGETEDPVREEPPDIWRPPLWETGYNTTGATFRLVSRVMWLRKRHNGLHQYRQRMIYADHEVLSFSRGPFIFISTNVGSVSSHESQRLMWNNVTESCLPVRVCDLLAIDIHASCFVVKPGRPIVVELADGEPKVLVPEELLEDMPSSFIESVTQRPAGRELEDPQKMHQQVEDVSILPRSRWHEMPEPPNVQIERIARMPRQQLPPGVLLNDRAAWLPAEEFRIPPHLNVWFPPLGTEPFRVETVVSRDTCYHADGRGGTFMLAQRSNAKYLLCTSKDMSCVEGSRLRIPEPLPPLDWRPVLALAFGEVSSQTPSSYDFLVRLLPSILPLLPRLRSGSARLLLHKDWTLLYPILGRLQIPSGALLLTSPDLPYTICSEEMRYVLEHQHQSRIRLAHLRSELDLPDGPLPAGSVRRSIVLLSRGNSTGGIDNEPELVDSLRELGRPVEVVNPEETDLTELIITLSRARAIVGPHGSNMASMMYAPEGTKVLEIVPQVPSSDRADYHYWALAGALGLPYKPLGQLVEGIDSSSRNATLKRFKVDTNRVASELASLFSFDS
eukprot:TRINITY_DN20428_c1_g2_i1.p1 TRINITY_DN20428_c1_g2~~TRINITY_DN20428_c1_g2_i1.p1  ORF type:complete len:1246 (+),score=130.38 TRINITY_DN20428_c1_g2_i1:121-3858(+)